MPSHLFVPLPKPCPLLGASLPFLTVTSEASAVVQALSYAFYMKKTL